MLKIRVTKIIATSVLRLTGLEVDSIIANIIFKTKNRVANIWLAIWPWYVFDDLFNSSKNIFATEYIAGYPIMIIIPIISKVWLNYKKLAWKEKDAAPPIMKFIPCNISHWGSLAS
jgi:hypothetical protein